MGCQASKTTTHPLLREDGFYYRRKSHDLFQLVKFYTNGRLAITDIYCKQEFFSRYQDRLACIVDTTANKRFPGLAMISFTLKNDSIHFLSKTVNPYSEPFNTLFLCKLNKDSLTVLLKAININSKRGKIEKTTKLVTFQFIRASCNPEMSLPDNKPQYDLDTTRSPQVK